LSSKPELRPAPLLTTETVVALQSLPLRLMSTNYTRIGRQRHLLNERNKATKSADSADYFKRSWAAGREFFDKK
jgi:hypothetical protein